LAFREPNLKLSDAQPFFRVKIQILIWTSVTFLIADISADFCPRRSTR
jgi:hypothetical protein